MKLLSVTCVMAAVPILADSTSVGVSANPIRKVVNMLEDMQKKVQEKGETEKKLFEEFECNCKSTKSDLTKQLDQADEQVASLPNEIEASEKQLVQVKEALKKAQTDRAAAKRAMADASAIRDKEAAVYSSLKAEADANINAIRKAVAAIESGAEGAFIQTNDAQVVERIVDAQKEMNEYHRDWVMSFLAGQSEDSGEIVGILKELGDEMSRNLAAATSVEDEKVQIFNGLIAAKTKEVGACGQAVEDKTQRAGELGIAVVDMKADLKDSEKALSENKGLIADLDKSCADKTAEFQEAVKTRGDEMTAIADTIKILNSDEALELFKKNLPAAGASFLQVDVSNKDVQKRALTALRQMRDATTTRHRAGFALITTALTGKNVNFDKVFDMIDDMVGVLQREQEGDDQKKEYCAAEFDAVDDKKKTVARKISKESTNVDRNKEAIATLTEEMDALEMGLRALDRSVVKVGDQRKAENNEFNQMMTGNTAAKELLMFARKRLEKFYQAFVQVSAPTAGKESNAVMAMLDTIVGDLDKEMTEGQAMETEAQKDYEAFTQASQEKRGADMKELEHKAALKADTEETLHQHEGKKASEEAEMMATKQYESTLHAECDFLTQNYDMRRSARTQEVESLKRAKDVLKGADYSLLQTSSATGMVTQHLRH